MSQQAHSDNRQGVADIENRYEAVKDNYTTMASMIKTGLSISPNQVMVFKAEITEASTLFVTDLWAHISVHRREAEQRTAAVQQLPQVTVALAQRADMSDSNVLFLQELLRVGSRWDSLVGRSPVCGTHRSTTVPSPKQWPLGLARNTGRLVAERARRGRGVKENRSDVDWLRHQNDSLGTHKRKSGILCNYFSFLSSSQL